MSNELVNYKSISDLSSFSNKLKEFIVKNNLYSNIKGKNYVNVEGWEFAGASMGIFPIVRSLEKMSTATPEEISYRAEVELMPINKKLPIGYGVAICSSKEGSKIGKDEYVIASMAQTRAIGKAYRNTFAYLMKMAGYEPTPAEEMTTDTKDKESVAVSNEIVAEYIKMIDGADTLYKLEQIKKKIVNCLANKIINNEAYKQLDAKIEGRKNGISKTG